MNLMDTSGWLEYFFAGPDADYFAATIEDTGTLIVPSICLYEVFRKVNQVGDESRALQAVAQMKQGQVLPVDETIALKAALVSIRHRLPMADSLIYATAVLHEAVLWTQDAHFRGLPKVNYRPAGTRP